MGKSEETRAYIIAKTSGLFNRKGYAATSLSDITGATQLTKGSVYGNFANKDEVALAAFDYNLKKLMSVLAAEMAEHESPREKLLVYVEVYSRYEQYPFPEWGCPLLNTAVEADDTHPVLRAKVVAALDNWRKKIIRILEEGIREKIFRKGIDTEQTALTIMAMIEGSLMLSRVTGRPAQRVAIMRSLRSYIESLQ